MARARVGLWSVFRPGSFAAQEPRAALATAATGAVISAGVAAAIGALALPGRWPLVAGLFVAQLLLVAGWLRFLDAPAKPFGFALGGGCALAADLLLARHETDVLGGLAGVVAIGLVVAIVFQLGWRHRVRVTEVVSAQTSAVLLVSSAACFVAVRGGHRGRDATMAVLLALAAGALGGRLAGFALPRPALVPGRGLLGPIVWAGIGAAVGVAVLGADGAALGAATALAGGLAEVGVAELGSTRRGLVVGALLPIAAGGPVAYLLSRVLLG